MWDETWSKRPGFDDLETTVLKDVPVFIEVRTDEYEMLDRDFVEKCVQAAVT